MVLYNHSPSLPVGFYIRTNHAALPGSIVTVRAADVAPALAAARGFGDRRDRFLKRVAASAGEEVCALDQAITIRERHVVTRHQHDANGRPLPQWNGCLTLGADELFLLGDTDDSFDGRYWGVVSHDLIEGVWRPIHFRSAND